MAAVSRTNFCDCLKPLRIISMVFGVDTHEIVAKEENDRRIILEIRRSSRTLIYFISNILTTLVLHFNFVYAVKQSGVHATDFVAHYILFPVGSNILFLATLIGRISIQLYSNTKLKIFNMFEEVDVELLDNAQEYYKKWSRNSTLGNAITFVILTVIYFLDLYNFVQVRNHLTFSVLIYKIVDSIFVTITVNYVHMVLLVRQRLGILNQKLWMECGILSANNTHIQSIKRHRIPSQGQPDQIRSPWRARAIEGTLGKELIRGYRLGILVKKIQSRQVVVINCVCSSTSIEARKTTGIIHDLLLQPGLSKEASEQLKEFSLQTSRRKIVFSAGGFVTLGLPLLSSMCVSAMSYVLTINPKPLHYKASGNLRSSLLTCKSHAFMYDPQYAGPFICLNHSETLLVRQGYAFSVKGLVPAVIPSFVEGRNSLVVCG
ncbi:hypothetical protein PR048_026020 [Dryococelus australis]|uniref:Gustatory receptor n=1 Tax=Dryococelus australis TaxID=614101 RepID=A0ABQ9GK64_9NEOP|nr:hypothetical protein PR048_026020 [Dryococelus australis]